jgi:hypothetical protein
MSPLDDPQATPPVPARCGHGGPRPGSGRKPKDRSAPLSEADLDYAKDLVSGDLDYAKDLVRALMRDESQPAELRARCALAVLIKGTSAMCHRRAKGKIAAAEASLPALP